MNSSDVSVCVCLRACLCVRDLVFPDSPTAATFTCITHTCLLRRPEGAALSPRLAAESQLRADCGAPGGAASVGVLCRKQLYHVIKAQICEPQSTVSQRLTGNFCACVCVVVAFLFFPRLVVCLFSQKRETFRRLDEV